MYASDWTMTGNANRDMAHPKWAFVPHMGACPWCVMVGSRGFVYRSEETAKSQRHANCVCSVVVDFDTKNPCLHGYDPDGMYQRMLVCAEAGSGIPGSHDWEEALKEARAFRDREWLRTGQIPAVGYDSPATEKKKRQDKSHSKEFRTATVLATHGYRVTFWDDEIHKKNPTGKGTITIGRPDLDTGVEIKTLNTAKSENTLSKHLASANKKPGMNRVFLDISQNASIDDEIATKWTTSGLVRHSMNEAWIIGHGKQLIRVRHPKR